MPEPLRHPGMTGRKIRPVTLLLFLIITVIILYHFVSLDDAGTALTSGGESSPVMTVNGEPVCEDEFIGTMSGLREKIFYHFSRKHDAGNKSEFWTTDYGGEVPADLLIQSTVEDMIRFKVEQLVMKTHGIAEDVCYEAFLEDLKQENQRRRSAMADNLPVFGPFQYEEKAYYQYLHSERTSKLKQLLAEKELLPGDGEIDVYYADNREKYRNPDIIKIERISLPEEYFEAIQSIEGATDVNVMEKIHAMIRNGDDFKTVANYYKYSGVQGIGFEILVLDGSTARIFVRMFPEITLQLNSLEIGQVSGIIREADTFNIIKITQRQEGKYRSLEEVKGQIVRELIDEKYERLIQKSVESADVILYSDRINGIPVN
jgi:hypothetical protein